MTQKSQTFPEYLGDISTEALLQNITNAQAEIFSSIERLRTEYSRGFAITAHFAALEPFPIGREVWKTGKLLYFELEPIEQ